MRCGTPGARCRRPDRADERGLLCRGVPAGPRRLRAFALAAGCRPPAGHRLSRGAVRRVPSLHRSALHRRGAAALERRPAAPRRRLHRRAARDVGCPRRPPSDAAGLWPALAAGFPRALHRDGRRRAGGVVRRAARGLDRFPRLVRPALRPGRRTGKRRLPPALRRAGHHAGAADLPDPSRRRGRPPGRAGRRVRTGDAAPPRRPAPAVAASLGRGPGPGGPSAAAGRRTPGRRGCRTPVDRPRGGRSPAAGGFRALFLPGPRRPPPAGDRRGAPPRPARRSGRPGGGDRGALGAGLPGGARRRLGRTLRDPRHGRRRDLGPAHRRGPDGAPHGARVGGDAPLPTWRVDRGQAWSHRRPVSFGGLPDGSASPPAPVITQPVAGRRGKHCRQGRIPRQAAVAAPRRRDCG